MLDNLGNKEEESREKLKQQKIPTSRKTQKTQSFRGIFNNLAKRLKKPRKSQSLKNTIKDALEETRNQIGDAIPQERVMLENLLSFNESNATDIMVPKPQVFAIDINTSLSKAKKMLQGNSFHTRILVFKDKIDNVVGFIHIKDLIRLVLDEKIDTKSFSIEKIIKNILFVPPSMKALSVFLKMQSAKVHIAAIIDEYGALSGIVTVNDLMSLIVGELEDEVDSDGNMVLEQINKGVFEVSANYELEKLENELAIKIHDSDDSDFNTIGGLVFQKLERIPVIGEVCRFEDKTEEATSNGNGSNGGNGNGKGKIKKYIELEVLRADPRRVHKFLLTIR